MWLFCFVTDLEEDRLWPLTILHKCCQQHQLFHLKPSQLQILECTKRCLLLKYDGKFMLHRLSSHLIDKDTHWKIARELNSCCQEQQQKNACFFFKHLQNQFYRRRDIIYSYSRVSVSDSVAFEIFWATVSESLIACSKATKQPNKSLLLTFTSNGNGFEMHEIAEECWNNETSGKRKSRRSWR